jgi:hypothetical protein
MIASAAISHARWGMRHGSLTQDYRHCRPTHEAPWALVASKLGELLDV